jgi:hypothetical protein
MILANCEILFHHFESWVYLYSFNMMKSYFFFLMVTNGILPTEFFMRRCDVPLPIHRAKWWEAPRTPGMILYRVVDSCLRHELSVLDLHFRTSACMLPCTCMQLRSWFMSSICRYFLGKLANLYSSFAFSLFWSLCPWIFTLGFDGYLSMWLIFSFGLCRKALSHLRSVFRQLAYRLVLIFWPRW